jgi:hypothetical protein
MYEAGVHAVEPALRLGVDGARVAAGAVLGLEDGDLVPRVEQVGPGQAGDARPDDGDPQHERAAPVGCSVRRPVADLWRR